MSSKRGPSRESHQAPNKNERLMSDVVRGGVRSWGSESFPTVAQANVVPRLRLVNSSSSHHPVTSSSLPQPFSVTPSSFSIAIIRPTVGNIPSTALILPSVPVTTSSLAPHRTWAQTAAISVNASSGSPTNYIPSSSTGKFYSSETDFTGQPFTRK